MDSKLPYVQEEAFPELFNNEPRLWVAKQSKIRRHNYKIIEGLERELAAIRGNRVYKTLAWLKVLPGQAKRKAVSDV